MSEAKANLSGRSSTIATSLAAAHALLIASVSPQWGAKDLTLVVVQLILATAALTFLLRANKLRKLGPDLQPLQSKLGMLLAFAGILFTLFGDTMYGGEGKAFIPFRFLLFPLMCIYFLQHTPPEKSLLRGVYQLRRPIFWFLLFSAVLFRFTIVPVSPDPLVDVFWFTNEGAAGLWDGINPYDRSFHIVDPKSVNLYAYLPAQFLFDLPANLLFGDMRWGQIILELLAAAMIYDLIQGDSKNTLRRHSAELMTLLLLFYPPVMKAHEHAWVEFKQLFAIVLFAWAAKRMAPGAKRFAPIGLLFSLKQTAWSAGPFILRHKDFSLRSALVILGVMAAFLLPFLIWNPEAFIDDIILYHVGLPLPESPSIAWAYKLITGETPGLLAVAVPGGLTLTYLWITGSRSTLGVLISAAALGFIPVILRQAYVNYYHYVDGMILTCLALTLREMHDRAEGITTSEG